MKKELTANPFSLLTIPKTFMIDITKIINNKIIEEDIIFTNKYKKFLESKSNGYITRMSLSRIKLGFYKRKAKGWKFIIDKVSDHDIETCIISIKGGARPLLYLYINPNQQCNYEYICADDIAVYRAYKKLKINKVPVIILGSIKELEETAFLIKSFHGNKDIINQFIFGTKIINKKSFPILLGLNKDEDISLKLKKLYNYMNELKENYRKFHLSNQDEIHYHNIIFSIIIRALEFIESIEILLKQDFYLPAISIARSLYELTLTFYISWLCPSLLPIIQLSSSVTQKEWKELWSLDGNYSDNYKKEFIDAMNFQYNLVDSVIEKAKISPFGEQYYKQVYSFFSKIVHHDFSVTARYKNALLYGDEEVYTDDIKESLIITIDSCIALIYFRISDEIGLKKYNN
ncbi:DUF5677 domain-containing protein [Aliarcobacter butzleri]|uniref:DUF5677 domain-containing protein n=1 Tax=Aliarcobacter butzleri TaxID=28197 RepID=UPI00263D2D5C|nr:hypothetical protein [Aliarcobacter butzleri]MDN5054998.1 hypothetical protein [Aliarcobacter butzleri]